MDAAGVAAEAGGVAVGPRDRGPALPHQLVHGHRGDQPVVDHDHCDAGRPKGAGHEAEIALVQPLPVAAMDENLDGRRRWARGRKDVERLAGMRAVGDIEPDGQRGAGRFALARVAGEPRSVVGHLGAVVVFPIERLLVVVAEDLAGHGSLRVRGSIAWAGVESFCEDRLHRRRSGRALPRPPAEAGRPGHDVTVFERNRPDETFGFGVVFSDATLENLARGRSRDATKRSPGPSPTGTTSTSTTRGRSCAPPATASRASRGAAARHPAAPLPALGVG